MVRKHPPVVNPQKRINDFVDKRKASPNGLKTPTHTAGNLKSMADGKYSVLIVEDHYATLDGLSLGLSTAPDIEVVGQAEQCEAGLRFARELKPDVIVLDLHLPGGPSPRLMVSAFIDASTSSKVIIFSAEARMAYIQAILSMGVAAYLLKTERVSTVADVIRRVMAGETGITSAQLAGATKKITAAEQEVLHLLAKGMKYQDIADHRVTSIATTRRQCENLLLKLGLETREQLIAWAVENGYGPALES